MTEYAILYTHGAFFAEAESNSWEKRAVSVCTVYNVTGIHPNIQIVLNIICRIWCNYATQRQHQHHWKFVFLNSNTFEVWQLAQARQDKWYDDYQEDDSNKCSDARSNNIFSLVDSSVCCILKLIVPNSIQNFYLTPFILIVSSTNSAFLAQLICYLLQPLTMKFISYFLRGIKYTEMDRIDVYSVQNS